MIVTLSAPGVAMNNWNETASCSAENWLHEMAELYLLAFLLTANKEVAEQCVLDSVDEYLNSGAPTLSNWVRSDGNNVVIANAVRLIKPRAKISYSWTAPLGARALLGPSHQPFAVITSLGTFERFVYVLTALEGRSEEECAVLLECPRADVVAARKLSDLLVGLSESGEPWPDRLDPLLLTDAVIHSRYGIA